MKKLWGGRFSKKTNPLAEKFTKSIDFDYKIAWCDVWGSLAHIKILKKSGYLSSNETAKLTKALTSIFNIVKKPNFKPSAKSEDIHTYVQNELQKKVGGLALKLHTARSRNDQVVFATKLYCKVELGKVRLRIAELARTILDLIKKNKGTIIPGVTHLQHAQPIYLVDYLGTYIDMLVRDSERLNYIIGNIRLTLGAGALAGTPITASKYNQAALELIKEIKGLGKFEALNIEPTTSSIDTVSDRDFVIEVISALSIIAMHLSRLAEDMIIWSTKEFDFVEIDEAFCTGSSLMPQKKNPDALELIRGYAGRLYGNLVSVLTMMKGLPLTYNRDMQLDKEPLFDSLAIVGQELAVLKGLVKTLKFNKAKIKEQLKDEALYATDLVYYLVDKKIPFQEAHAIVGKLVRYSLENKVEIKDLPEEKLKDFSNKFVKKEVVKLFDPEVSVKSKKSVQRKTAKIKR